VANAIPKLTTMSVPDGFVAARALLAEAGVALTFVREVNDTRVCAATWWISGERPAIGITERLRKPDVFWFNLLHEIGHIVLHPRRTSYLNLDADDRLTARPKVRPDAYATDMLLSGDANDQIAQARSHQDLVLIAARLGIGVPSIAGRHGRLTQKWNVAGRLRGKITDDDIQSLETAVKDAAA
jgi:HTH-type transcriptional regulator/antitoxin HigA